MNSGNDGDENPQSATGSHETENQGGESRIELPPAGASPQQKQLSTAGCPSNKESSKWRENAKLGLEIVGLAALIVYTVFSVLQWAQIRWTNRLTREALDGSNVSLNQTLGKMQGQINQMSRLADKAGVQADRTKDLADRMKDQTGRTKIIADEAVIQAKAAQTSADAATKSANTARDILLAQRPWLSLTPVGAGDVNFDNNGGSFPVAISVHNSGPLPAIRYRLAVEMKFGEGPSFTAETERYCKEQILAAKANEGTRFHEGTIFPGNDIPEETTFSGITAANALLGKYLSPKIVACVIYQSPLDPLEWKYTGEIYDLQRWSSDVPNGRLSFIFGDTVKKENIIIGRSYIYPTIAK